ncbi:Hypothetical predicted protein [Podarcis lilfordi]|uniref:Uncharacterized protein n=1 Tax=Podarcis lilfordi TaxID=74358 RepID=A0AA35JY97_9SAUR|nr:Hypothetical predicted protein [Podarcis lilfordi]
MPAEPTAGEVGESAKKPSPTSVRMCHLTGRRLRSSGWAAVSPRFGQAHRRAAPPPPSQLPPPSPAARLLLLLLHRVGFQSLWRLRLLLGRSRESFRCRRPPERERRRRPARKAPRPPGLSVGGNGAASPARAGRKGASPPLPSSGEGKEGARSSLATATCRVTEGAATGLRQAGATFAVRSLCSGSHPPPVPPGSIPPTPGSLRRQGICIARDRRRGDRGTSGFRQASPTYCQFIPPPPLPSRRPPRAMAGMHLQVY